MNTFLRIGYVLRRPFTFEFDVLSIKYNVLLISSDMLYCNFQDYEVVLICNLMLY